MKKKRISIIVATAMFGLLSVLSSCGERFDFQESSKVESEVLSKEAVKNASLREQLKYKEYYLREATKLINQLGVSVLDISNASAKGVQKNTTTLKSLLSSLPSTTKRDDLQFSDILNSFKGLEERDFEISFYVPFAEKIVNNAAKNQEIKPIYIFEGLEDSKQLEFEGFTLSEDGTFVSYDKLISEELAEELTEKGYPIVVVGLQDSDIVINNGQAYSGNSKKALWISNLVVKSHKESWIAGASEVTIQMYKSYNGIIDKINFFGNVHLLGPDTEHIFAEARRKAVRRQREVSIHSPQLTYNAIDTTPSIFNNTQFFYVIYESDNFPTNRRVVNFTNQYDGKTVTIRYYSSDSEYYNSNTHNNKIQNFVENGEIRFRTQIR